MAEYTIRQGNIEDAAALAAVEAECFPKAEAATAEEIRERLSVYPNHFLLLYRDGKLVGFIDGMTTEEKDLQDEMYEDASLHNERRWQMIFGLNTIPAFRRQGCAGRLIEAFKKQARDEGKRVSSLPARTDWFTTMQDSALSMKGSPAPPMVMWYGTR